MSQSISIQEITPTYIPHVDPREWSVEAFKIAFDALNVPNAVRLVALEGKEAVGFAAYRLSEDTGCELVSLAAKYPNHAIGTALVDYIRKDYDVWVVADRKADKFYEKLGFEDITNKLDQTRANYRKVYQWTA